MRESWADLVLRQQQHEDHIALKQNTRGGSGMLHPGDSLVTDSKVCPGGWGSGSFLLLEGYNFKNETKTKGVVMYACNSRRWEAKAGLSQDGGQTGLQSRVPDQLQLCSKVLLQRKKQAANGRSLILPRHIFHIWFL